MQALAPVTRDVRATRAQRLRALELIALAQFIRNDQAAARATFERRSTPMTAALPALISAPFYASADRLTQWRAYVTRNDLTGAPADFQAVGELLTRFLQPVWARLLADADAAGSWPPGGPWSPHSTEPS